MIDEESLVVQHTFDKENFEEYLRYYLDDESIVISDKQWRSIAKHLDHEVESFYDNLLQDTKQHWRDGFFNEEGGAVEFVRILGL